MTHSFREAAAGYSGIGKNGNPVTNVVMVVAGVAKYGAAPDR